MTNHLGRVYGVFDQTGARVESHAYSPYGAISGDDLSVQPFGMSTKRSDFESGLVYFGYRFYVPHLGRWLNRDPLQEQGGINLYGYVHGDPLGYVDPDGRMVMVAPLLPPTGYSGNNGNLSSRGNGGMVRPPHGSSHRYESRNSGPRVGRYALSESSNSDNKADPCPDDVENEVSPKVVNRANHLFGPKALKQHKLEGLLGKFSGNKVKAFLFIEQVTQKLANGGKISSKF